MLEEDVGTDVPEESADADAPEDSLPDTSDMDAEALRAELEKWRNKANETIDSRQKAKEKARTLESELREERKRRAELEKAADEDRKSKLKKKERYDELIREEEELSAARSQKLKSLLEGRQFEDLFSKVMEQGGIDSANQKVLKPFLRDIAKDLDLITEIDPTDIESIEIRGADEKSVAAALRQLRKDAPGFFNQSASGGERAAKAEDTGAKRGIKLPPGVDPNDPRLAAVLKAARGG